MTVAPLVVSTGPESIEPSAVFTIVIWVIEVEVEILNTVLATEIGSPFTSTVKPPIGWFAKLIAMLCALTALSLLTVIVPALTVNVEPVNHGLELETEAVPVVVTLLPFAGTIP